MKMLSKLVVGLATVLLLTGCTYKGSVGVSNVDISKTDISKLDGLKTGEACQRWIFFLPIANDATAKQAAKNGGISKIEYQEYSSTNYLIGGSFCVKVYGK